MITCNEMRLVERLRDFGAGGRYAWETRDAGEALMREVADAIERLSPSPASSAEREAAIYERCAQIAEEVAHQCEADEQNCDVEDKAGADWAFGGKMEARRIAKLIRAEKR